eukprot:1158818-Pelagomonas_calceolata.AAC.7
MQKPWTAWAWTALAWLAHSQQLIERWAGLQAGVDLEQTRSETRIFLAGQASRRLLSCTFNGWVRQGCGCGRGTVHSLGFFQLMQWTSCPSRIPSVEAIECGQIFCEIISAHELRSCCSAVCRIYRGVCNFSH